MAASLDDPRYAPSGTPTLFCTITTKDGDPATTDFRCTEHKCEAYPLPDGVEGGDSGGCTDNIVLGAATNNECSLQCKA